MALSSKQQRNGITQTGGGSGANVAKPSANATREVVGVKRQAEAAGNRRKVEAATLMESPAGSGAAGHQIGANGDMWAWDSGLAINDVEGGGSG